MAIFTIDGNIGSGKSTVLEYIHRHYQVPIDPEPVAKWQPYLEDVYRNKKSPFELQVRVWLDRCLVQQRPNMAPIVMERSPFFQYHVFVSTNLEMGNLNLREFAMLQEMYQRSGAMWQPRGHVYLRSDPGRCKDRIRRRNRDSEENITLEYIQRLHHAHEQAYITGVTQCLPIIVIDVEGKSVPTLAAEIVQALTALGFVQYGFFPPPPPVQLPTVSPPPPPPRRPNPWGPPDIPNGHGNGHHHVGAVVPNDVIIP